MAELRMIPPSELEAREKEAQAIQAAGQISVGVPIQNLAAHVRSQWQDALISKIPYERQMLDNKRQRNGEYDPKQLAAIKSMHGDDYKPVWLNITETKCRAGISWVRDIIFQPGMDPFDVKPTPLPELPPPIVAQLEKELFETMVSEYFQEAMLLGQLPDLENMNREFEKLLPDMEKKLDRRLMEMALEGAEKAKQRIADQFREGGWYPAVETGLYDIITLGTMIHKGPTVVRDLIRARAFNKFSGRFDPTIAEKVMVKHGRVNPLNMYPGPDNRRCDDGYTCEKISLSRMDLSNLIGLEGFDDDAIRAVLAEHEQGGLREWTNIDQEKADLEGKQGTDLHQSRRIDCIEYWGSASGRVLKEYGFDDPEINDPAVEYPIGTWLIGTKVIKALINPDPFGKTPYSKAGYIEDPDSFWAKGVPQLIQAPQAIGNAAGRALVNNVAIASGPQVEINVDRKAPGTTSTIYPWKVWETDNQGVSEGPAVNFYMPKMVADKLMQVFDWCSTIADEDSGIPRYAHGELGSPAPETASATSMLMTAAARGIKNVIRNIDRGVIQQSVEKQFYFNVDFDSETEPLLIGDVKIVASGASSLIAKEQQSIRRKEILAESNNEIDNQIFQTGGRKAMWEEVLKASEMDAEKIFAEAQKVDGLNAAPPGMMPPVPGQLPASTEVDAAGTPVGGNDSNLEVTPAGRAE